MQHVYRDHSELVLCCPSPSPAPVTLSNLLNLSSKPRLQRLRILAWPLTTAGTAIQPPSFSRPYPPLILPVQPRC
jgi:hypothetical protein